MGDIVLSRFAPSYMGFGRGRTLSAEEVARRYDLVLAHTFMFRGEVPRMRAVNPDLRVLAYVNAGLTINRAVHPESWYAHDAKGMRIAIPSFRSWVMEPSNPAWQKHVFDTCVSERRAAGYDGCFLDNLGSGVFVGGYSSGIPVVPGTSQPYTPAGWIGRTEKIAAAVRGEVEQVAVNGVANGPRYFQSGKNLLGPASQGTMAEAFLRSSETPATIFPGESAWKSHVEMLVHAEAEGRGILATTKLWLPDMDAATQDRWHEFALATFLLGAGGRSKFSFSTSQTFDGVSSDHRWDRAPIGAPLGSYRKAGSVYRRDFSGGIVLVNPGSKAVTVNVGEGYVDLRGARRATVKLSGSTGLVLLRK